MPDSAGLMAVNGTHTTDANMEKVVKLQLDLIAFAFASDRARAATLQVGGCNDHTKYTINGVQAPPYHFISHRVLSDGGSGTRIANAVELHHQIDRIHARFFKHFLDRLAAVSLPEGGTLLDASANLWTNSIADGPPHSGNNVPHIIGGRGGRLPENRPACPFAGPQPPGAEHDHQRRRRPQAQRRPDRQLRRPQHAGADRRSRGRALIGWPRRHCRPGGGVVQV